MPRPDGGQAPHPEIGQQRPPPPAIRQDLLAAGRARVAGRQAGFGAPGEHAGAYPRACDHVGSGCGDDPRQRHRIPYISPEREHAPQPPAGERDVLVHGAVTARLALAAGVLDELQIHLIPVLLGQGERLFDDMPPEHIELEPVRALDGSGVLHLRYRVWAASE